MADHNFSRSILLIAALVASSAGLGCPSKHAGPTIGRLPVITSADPKAEAEIKEARELLERGAVEAAEKGYREFMTRRPDDPLVPVAKLALGRIRLAQNRLAEARALFAVVIEHPEAAVSEQGRFYDGIAAHLQGDDQAAIATLKPMQGRTIDPEDTALLLRTLAAASERIGDYRGALDTLDRLVREAVPERDRAEAGAELAEIAEKKASAEQIDVAYKQMDRSGAAWPLVARRALRDADRAGDVERINEILEDLRDEEVAFDEEIEALALRAARPKAADSRAVGAILSLSGRVKKVGELALRGLMLAAGLPLQGPPAPDAPRLVFRDDGGEPERAVQAVNELVSLHRVVAIVGPIEARAAAAAARRAQELGVPLIALTPAGDVTEAGSMVFRLFPTPENEVRRLVAHALGRKARRFAILYPQAAYGTVMREAFEREVKSRGGETVAAEAFDPAATSFGPVISRLASSRFDSLFIPAPSEKVALIAPALAAADLWSAPAETAAPGKGRAILLLGPSVAFDQGLAISAGRYLQGAVFCSAFDAATAEGSARQFSEKFEEQFGSAPDQFAAFAHDAYQFIRAAVAGGAVTRKQVADSLRTARYHQAAGPGTGFSTDREPLQATRLLELQGDSFVQIDPGTK